MGCQRKNLDQLRTSQESSPLYYLSGPQDNSFLLKLVGVEYEKKGKKNLLKHFCYLFYPIYFFLFLVSCLFRDHPAVLEEVLPDLGPGRLLLVQKEPRRLEPTRAEPGPPAGITHALVLSHLFKPFANIFQELIF